MNFKFCPNCGQKGTVQAETPTKATCSNCGEAFWNNPRATVAIVFLKGDQALFAKRGIEPNKGKYDFPGGFVEYNEDAYDACIREIQEELGLTLKRSDLRLLAVHTAEYLPGTSVADLVFVTAASADNAAPADDVAALEWKPLTFMNSPAFVPLYSGTEELLANYISK
jgi:ADP-ribose pyrophosphatase YjhB (NUDIX family)